MILYRQILFTRCSLGPCLQWVKSCQECIVSIPLILSLPPPLYNDTTNPHYASLLNHLKVISLHLSLCQECQSFHSATHWNVCLYFFKSCFLITFKSPFTVPFYSNWVRQFTKYPSNKWSWISFLVRNDCKVLSVFLKGEWDTTLQILIMAIMTHSRSRPKNINMMNNIPTVTANNDGSFVAKSEPFTCRRSRANLELGSDMLGEIFSSILC